jgi:3-hydroxyacyl-[acyl-carrier-protein] dehydratase
MLVTNEEITKFLPHREPFLFIDKIVEIELGKSIHCIKNNKPSEDFFRGHFPDNPCYAWCYYIRSIGSSFWNLRI